MPRLRRLSGHALVRELSAEGFSLASQRGSHAKLVRSTAGAERQVLVVPLHAELATGTLRAIARQAQRFLSAEVIERIFYRDS